VLDYGILDPSFVGIVGIVNIYGIVNPQLGDIIDEPSAHYSPNFVDLSPTARQATGG